MWDSDVSQSNVPATLFLLVAIKLMLILIEAFLLKKTAIQSIVNLVAMWSIDDEPLIFLYLLT